MCHRGHVSEGGCPTCCCVGGPFRACHPGLSQIILWLQCRTRVLVLVRCEYCCVFGEGHACSHCYS